MFKIIKEVRGQGFIIGVEFVNSDCASEVVKKLYQNGVLTIITEQKNIRILPPLITTKKEVDFALKIFESSLHEVLDA
ncbi:MAG: aminotransferase class III-fold pyridoxal phosphate-dependent enzyme [Nanoarchaeota archaeon]|nr:aminotransferase class III-fold pyridoxal phosphate-dependent enzyme [Nanoarchaeota archaeon]